MSDTIKRLRELHKQDVLGDAIGDAQWAHQYQPIPRDEQAAVRDALDGASELADAIPALLDIAQIASKVSDAREVTLPTGMRIRVGILGAFYLNELKAAFERLNG